MYNIGTVTTTANSTKIMGTGTRWKDNTNLISVGQVIVIKNDTSGLPNEVNTIYSIESNTELTLALPVSAKLTNAKYAISTTMIDSISDGVNKATAQVIASEIFTDIFTELMTGTGTLDFELPNGQKVKLRTEAERDKLLDGKFDKTGGNLLGHLSVQKESAVTHEGHMMSMKVMDTTRGPHFVSKRGADGAYRTHELQDKSGALMHLGDFGWGGYADNNWVTDENTISSTLKLRTTRSSLWRNTQTTKYSVGYSACAYFRVGDCWFNITVGHSNGVMTISSGNADGERTSTVYSSANTTKDSNGNLKAASPIVKVFADHIELNEESEGVEMEHLGVGHYLIKGVVGFNADGAWGINNGFVIPQDHNGKNMVLIDYNVKQDGDIELFVFHQQNAEMPERFQNKRIKHFDEEGVPVYFENYEPCDVPESRWIDMRVEMPPNSIYNLKQAEAERLAKEAAEKQAEEEAKKAELEAEEGDDI
ncbi:hypothetical protein [Providencia sp. PROV236]|uniref:phage tail fiber protein n=1 Tax=Providencia sp. PROV236 TaxID=2936798 RepID=UPI0034E25D1B